MTAQCLATLKRQHEAVILAHNYQPADIQNIADHVGDSFELSLLASRTDARVIVFCGVHFMAETAAILAPERPVLLPAAAGCALADTVTVSALRSLRQRYPRAAVVSYVNTSAAVKAESDVCVTSANAVTVVGALPEEEIIFVPDANLGRFIAERTGKRVITSEGNCPAHHAVTVAELEQARQAYPGATVMVHPEAPPAVAARADLVLGTGGMVRQAGERPEREFIIGTEAGMLHRLRLEHPDKDFHLLSGSLWCRTMKHISRGKIIRALENMSPRVEVAPDIANRARQALQRMLELSGNG